jgi:hypothetical protein
MGVVLSSHVFHGKSIHMEPIVTGTVLPLVCSRSRIRISSSLRFESVAIGREDFCDPRRSVHTVVQTRLRRSLQIRLNIL